MNESDQIAVASEYYELINKPVAARQKPQFALCMIGLVGAGKSTVLKKLSQLLPLVSESGDEVRKLLHDKGLPPIDSETLARIGGRVTGRLFSEGYRVAYDNDFANPRIRKSMVEDNRARGVPVIWIRIAPPEDEADSLDALPYIYTFDTSAPTIDHQVREAAELIQGYLTGLRTRRRQRGQLIGNSSNTHRGGLSAFH